MGVATHYIRLAHTRTKARVRDSKKEGPHMMLKWWKKSAHDPADAEFQEMGQSSQSVTFLMKVPAKVRQEGGVFYSSCPVFDVHSQGDTQQSALDHLVEALQVFVETCYEQGTLHQVLKEQGFMPGHQEDPQEQAGCTINVPFALIARRHAENLTH